MVRSCGRGRRNGASDTCHRSAQLETVGCSAATEQRPNIAVVIVLSCPQPQRPRQHHAIQRVSTIAGAASKVVTSTGRSAVTTGTAVSKSARGGRSIPDAVQRQRVHVRRSKHRPVRSVRRDELRSLPA